MLDRTNRQPFLLRHSEYLGLLLTCALVLSVVGNLESNIKRRGIFSDSPLIECAKPSSFLAQTAKLIVPLLIHFFSFWISLWFLPNGSLVSWGRNDLCSCFYVYIYIFFNFMQSQRNLIEKKKFRALTGFKPITCALLVQCRFLCSCLICKHNCENQFFDCILHPQFS